MVLLDYLPEPNSGRLALHLVNMRKIALADWLEVRKTGTLEG